MASDTQPQAEKITKRTDYLSWDDYFMSLVGTASHLVNVKAFLSSMRSKDPNTQVGACIINQDRKIVGIGYNGLPWGCNDDEFPWERVAESALDTKYPFVCHAEMNAILNSNTKLKGCYLYVTLFPCNECAKLIIQAGITEVVYYGDKYHDQWQFVASRKMMDAAGVKYRQHIPKDQSITLNYQQMT